MAGVEILSTEKIVSEYMQYFDSKIFWITFLITFLVAIIITILVILTSDNATTKDVLACGIFVVIFSCVMGTTFGWSAHKPVAYKTQYKVTISDEVKMNEFNKRYEVIDQEGKIYTVEKRED